MKSRTLVQAGTALVVLLALLATCVRYERELERPPLERPSSSPPGP